MNVNTTETDSFKTPDQIQTTDSSLVSDEVELLGVSSA